MRNDVCTTNLVQLSLSYSHYVFILSLPFSLYCFWLMRRENNKVVSEVVPKWLSKYHYSKFLWHLLIFSLIQFLVDKMLFLYFRQLVRDTKSCVVVWWGTISVFVLPLPLVCPVPETVFTNQKLYNWSCHVMSFIF